MVDFHPKFSSDVETDDETHTHTPPQEGLKRFIINMMRVSGESRADFPNCSKQWLPGKRVGKGDRLWVFMSLGT